MLYQVAHEAGDLLALGLEEELLEALVRRTNPQVLANIPRLDPIRVPSTLDRTPVVSSQVVDQPPVHSITEANLVLVAGRQMPVTKPDGGKSRNARKENSRRRKNRKRQEKKKQGRERRGSEKKQDGGKSKNVKKEDERRKRNVKRPDERRKFGES